METRLTLRPGQHGTKMLDARFGQRLVRVRDLYDAEAGRRLKTVELIVESVPWTPRAPRRRDDEIVAGASPGTNDLRERASASAPSGAPQSVEMRWLDGRLGLASRVVTA